MAYLPNAEVVWKVRRRNSRLRSRNIPNFAEHPSVGLLSRHGGEVFHAPAGLDVELDADDASVPVQCLLFPGLLGSRPRVSEGSRASSCFRGITLGETDASLNSAEQSKNLAHFRETRSALGVANPDAGAVLSKVLLVVAVLSLARGSRVAPVYQRVPSMLKCAVFDDKPLCRNSSTDTSSNTLGSRWSYWC